VQGVVVRVRFQNRRQLKRLWVKDISRGGMFLRTQSPLDVFEKVTVVLELPDGSQVDLHGSVVHVIPPDKATDKASAGMGVQFTDLTPDKRDLLEAFLERSKTQVSRVTAPSVLDTESFAEHIRHLLWLSGDPDALTDADYYAILGVPPDAPVEAIIEACSVLKILCDRAAVLERQLADIEATLTDQTSRMEYDAGRGVLR
jgi:uncharacterized protein (TIGR02266 family)